MKNYARFQDKIDVSRAISVSKNLTCWWKRPKPMIKKAQAQAQIQVQASTQAQQIEDMGKLSIIGCLSFIITFEYF